MDTVIKESVRMQKQNRYRNFTTIKFYVLLILSIVLILIAASASKLVPYDPYIQDLSKALEPPGNIHWLGTDRYGRDMLSRVMIGGQTTIFSALFLVAAISCFGTVIGVICGYIGGRSDAFIMRASDIFLAFPGMVFAIAVASVLGGGIINAVVALACISWPKYARLARGQVLVIKNMPYIAAAKMSGSGAIKIIIKHIIPNIVGVVLITAALDIGTMIMELAGLSFLGLGAIPPVAEWGAMMSDGRSMLQTSPWVILSPGCAIFISVMLFNLLGDTTRDLLDPKINKLKETK